ncbi:MAG TPA: adenine deaminase [Nitrolancea sp.]|jgi:adenine deaminase|nr:adenine deaminase [Nitrolancea sp.]
MVERWRRFLAVAERREAADLLWRDVRMVNVASGEIERVNIAIADGIIAGIGDYTEAERVIDLSGDYLAPSFIDGHVHVESSMLWVDQFARAVVPHGTGAVVTDPHEIANVAGLPGIKALMAAAQSQPLDLYFTIPSCVPASSHESSGAEMTTEIIREALTLPNVVGLGEMMNFPGVLSGDESIFAKLALPAARRDGHAPGVRGDSINAYAGSGMTSDHESTELEEAREKLRRGMMLMIREGSTEHNLLELLPLVDDRTYPRCCFASDDRDCATLLHDGHIDAVLRKAIAAGLDPIRAIRMATLATAEYWRLPKIGQIAPGFRANAVVFSELNDIRPQAVFFDGTLVAERGRPLIDAPADVPETLLATVHMAPLDIDQLRPVASEHMVAVGAIPGQIVTQKLEVQPKIEDGRLVADVDRDLLKLVVVERHHATGRVGVGLVSGFGLNAGALASSIAHDAHNIVAVGVDDRDILAAVQVVAEMQGGLAVVCEGSVLAQLALPIGGILSPEPLEEVTAQYEALEDLARSLGSQVPAPFGLLSFMALSVIPAARVTDQGIVTFD